MKYLHAYLRDPNRDPNRSGEKNVSSGEPTKPAEPAKPSSVVGFVGSVGGLNHTNGKNNRCTPDPSATPTPSDEYATLSVDVPPPDKPPDNLVGPRRTQWGTWAWSDPDELPLDAFGPAP